MKTEQEIRQAMSQEIIEKLQEILQIEGNIKHPDYLLITNLVPILMGVNDDENETISNSKRSEKEIRTTIETEYGTNQLLSVLKHSTKMAARLALFNLYKKEKISEGHVAVLTGKIQNDQTKEWLVNGNYSNDVERCLLTIAQYLGSNADNSNAGNVNAKESVSVAEIENIFEKQHVDIAKCILEHCPLVELVEKDTQENYRFVHHQFGAYLISQEKYQEAIQHDVMAEVMGLLNNNNNANSSSQVRNVAAMYTPSAIKAERSAETEQQKISSVSPSLDSTSKFG